MNVSHFCSHSDRVLTECFHFCSLRDREDFHRAIQELRRAHNGTLTGLSLEFILRHLTQMLIARGMKPHNTALVSSVCVCHVCLCVCVWGLGQMVEGGWGWGNV